MDEKYVGATTDHLYCWDDVYGWIHYTETEKMKEAYKRFCDALQRKKEAGD